MINSIAILMIAFTLLVNLTTERVFYDSFERIDARNTSDPFSEAVVKGIDSLYKVSINEIDHAVFIKSKNITNPILLILHGGPGFSDYYLWQTYNKELEKEFTVVTYDQRGSGLTFTVDTPAESMTFSQLTDDAHKLIAFLKREFKQQKIYLIGYSAGSITGVYLSSLYPDDIAAYIGVGQVVHGRQNEKQCLAYTYRKAVENKDKEAIKELKPLLKNYPSGTIETKLRDLKTLRKWNRKYYGDFCEGTSMDKLFAGIDPYIKENVNFQQINKGENFSMRMLWDEIIDLDLFSTHKTFEIPMYFMVGMCDYNTPYLITRDYYELIEAPDKKIFYFENSGHYMQFVEADKFNSLMISEIINPKGIGR